jgi:atypical dual specificity phosphatase
MPMNRPNIYQSTHRGQSARIWDRLWLGGAEALTASQLYITRPTLILNTSVEVQFIQVPSGVQQVRVPLRDTHEFSLRPHMDWAIDMIATHLSSSRRATVLVLCAGGVSRSPAVMMAYLMKHLRFTLEEAYDHVYTMRPYVRPNNHFFEQLLEFERELHGSNSCRLVRVERDECAAIVPNFFILPEYYRPLQLEMLRQRLPLSIRRDRSRSPAERPSSTRPLHPIHPGST